MTRIQSTLIIALATIATSTFAVDIFPYHESFESGYLDFGAWTQPTSDDLNWSMTTGPTGSFNTGPAGAHDRDTYIYTEASGSGYPLKTAIISAEFDFSTLSNPFLSFYYHMHGGSMGKLYVEVDSGDGNGWEDVLHKFGQKHASEVTPWTHAEIDLSAYGNMTNVNIRFRGITGTYYTSDMCIDDIWVYENTATLDHFVWSALSERQESGAPIPVTITAVDDAGNTVSTFDETIEISAWSDGFPDSCQNGDFSENRDYWTEMDAGGTPGPYSIKDMQWRLGKAFAMKPDHTADGMTQDISLNEGERYTISATCYFVNTHSSINLSDAIRSRILINDQVIDSASVPSLSGGSLRTSYFFGYFIPPTNGTYTLKLISEADAVQNANRWTYFTDVSVSFAPPQHIVTSPSVSGQFVNGVWTGTVMVDTRLPATHLIARYADILSESGMFSTYTSALDLDGDGILDSWEVVHFGNAAACSPLVDTDDDGYSNYDEFIIGSIPNLKSSSLALTSTNSTSDHCILNWYSVAGRSYEVQWTPNLIVTPFSNVATGIGHPQGSYTNALAPDSNLGFYRIKVRKN